MTTLLKLTSVHADATTFSFHGRRGASEEPATEECALLVAWALCTVNDRTGELLITSDWGSWSNRWNVNALGAPTMIDFLADRTSVDYLARKLQREGSEGRRFSAMKTATALRQRLSQRRLEDGREQIDGRLEPEDLMDDGSVPPHMQGRYDEHGLPLLSHRRVAAPRWDDPLREERLTYLTREKARKIWGAIGELADDLDTGRPGVDSLFWERLPQIDGFTEYVTDTPYEYAETEQTNEDRVLREVILPALIGACTEVARRRVLALWFTAAPQPPADGDDDT